MGYKKKPSGFCGGGRWQKPQDVELEVGIWECMLHTGDVFVIAEIEMVREMLPPHHCEYKCEVVDFRKVYVVKSVNRRSGGIPYPLSGGRPGWRGWMVRRVRRVSERRLPALLAEVM